MIKAVVVRMKVVTVKAVKVAVKVAVMSSIVIKKREPQVRIVHQVHQVRQVHLIPQVRQVRRVRRVQPIHILAVRYQVHSQARARTHPQIVIQIQRKKDIIISLLLIVCRVIK